MPGYVRTPGQGFNQTLKSDVKLETHGLVISRDADGNGILSTATSLPWGVAPNSTMDVQKYGLVGDQTYKAGGSVPLVRGGQVELAVANNNAAIAVGDELVCSGEGKVIKSSRAADAAITTVAHVLAELKRVERVVAIADEAVSAGTTNAPGKSHVRANLRVLGGAGP